METSLKNKVIYHYTTFQNFINIIQSKQIWFGRIGASNDSKEGKWLIDIIEQNSPAIYGIWKKLQKDGTISFKGCFCKSKDNLSLWRGYSDNATGIALGFEIQEKDDNLNAINSPISSAILSEIEYYDIKDTTPIDDLIKEKSNIYNKIRQLYANQQEQQEIKENLLRNTFRRYNNVIKHICFKSEQETAVIVSTNETEMKNNPSLFNATQTKFLFPVSETKEQNNMILDSVDGNYYNLVFKKVVIAPKNTTLKDGIDALLKCNKFNNIKISSSHIPYR